MFDKLIESGLQGGRRRTGGYFAGATLAYFAFLVVSASVTIMWFNPGLVEALELNARLVPPPPPTGPPKIVTRLRSGATRAVDTGLVVPTRVAPVLAVRANLPVANNDLARLAGPAAIGGPVGPPGGSGGPGVPGAEGERSAPPPPREEKPVPPAQVAKPTEPSRISEGVLRGRAISAYTPPYPELARRTGISGAVQVQILISEDGRVIDATVLNGNPMLRNTALQAARRWVFSPTRLSGMPVKVQGILTFNFTLN
ncbi:MAG: energy transducer TonB [Acidobacteriota bacterium]